jgi:hypothetical protein
MIYDKLIYLIIVSFDSFNKIAFIKFKIIICEENQLNKTHF